MIIKVRKSLQNGDPTYANAIHDGTGQPPSLHSKRNDGV